MFQTPGIVLMEGVQLLEHRRNPLLGMRTVDSLIKGEGVSLLRQVRLKALSPTSSICELVLVLFLIFEEVPPLARNCFVRVPSHSAVVCLSTALTLPVSCVLFSAVVVAVHNGDGKIVKYDFIASWHAEHFFVKGHISNNLYLALLRIPNSIEGIGVVATVANKDTNCAVRIQL
jgi:hypothetical protein